MFKHQTVAQTKRGAEWLRFSEKVLAHIENYTVPQYGDEGEDNIGTWTIRECINAVKKYCSRSGHNARANQDQLDMLKVAHYACFIHNKFDSQE
jgi:hypothetical protein